MSSSKRDYKPTTDELNEAIEDYLHEHPKASTTAVRTAVVKKHKTWVIPERRLNKFVKKQKAGKPMTADDETAVGFKGFFTTKGKASEAAPAKKKYTPKLSTGEAIVVPKKGVPKKEEEPVLVDETPETTDKSPDAYVDDNDGKKGGPLEVCEGCTIL